ncbi:MAG: SMP-30/gluconolactonase/LRE family protein [Chloroflexi bacterium]|nr:SMP-30/gluconolactonase/LRE family protein [Chloroflexota bacterium]
MEVAGASSNTQNNAEVPVMSARAAPLSPPEPPDTGIDDLSEQAAGISPVALPSVKPWMPADGAAQDTLLSALPLVVPSADLARTHVGVQWIALSFTVTFLVYVSFIPQFLRYSSPPTGDQPFYLMETISIVQDRDINVANNYAASDFDKFYKLAPHPSDFVGIAAPYPLPAQIAATPGRPPAEQYSNHLPGLPLLLVPAWVIGGWFSLWWPATIVFMCIIGALVAVNIFLLGHEMTGRKWIAWAVWLPMVFSNPLMTYSYMIFTELTVGLLLIYALRRLALGWGANNPLRLWLVGACIGYIPWVAWRCLPIAVGLCLYAVVQWWRYYRLTRGEKAEGTRIVEGQKRNTAAIPWLAWAFTPIIISALLLLEYNLSLFNSVMPSLTVPELGQQNPFHWPWLGFDAFTTFLTNIYGILFDQQMGLLIYAPIYLLAVVGIIAMFRTRRASDKRLLLAMLVAVLPYAGLIAAFEFWHGIWSPPARYMTTLVPLLAAPLAMSLYACRNFIYKIIYALLALVGFGLMAIMLRDARHMWPTSPVFAWLAQDPASPVRIDLRQLLPAIFHMDMLRLPSSTAVVTIASLSIILFSYLLMTRQGAMRNVDKSSFALHSVIWVVALGAIGSSWFVVNYQNLKHKTTLVEERRWWLPIASKGPDDRSSIAYLDNNIYVAGYNSQSVGVLDLGNGGYKSLSAVSLQGATLPYAQPGAIAVGPDNLLYLLNNGADAQAMYVMQPGGKVVRQEALNGKSPIAVGLAFGPDGKIYIGDMLGGRIIKYPLTGGAAMASWQNTTGSFNNPAGLAVDTDGAIYAAESSNKQVLRLNTNGQITAKYPFTCTPWQMAVRGDWVDVLCKDGPVPLMSINKKDGSTQASKITSNTMWPVAPTGMTYGLDNTLYILDGKTIIAYKVEH